MKSIFTDKKTEPSDSDLVDALSGTYSYWKDLEAFTKRLAPNSNGLWHFSGDKFGWGFRISYKNRVLVYLLPRDKFFKIALVFGQKATDEILKSNISASIRKELLAAKPYAEGRGIRISVTDNSMLNDIKNLITIKIHN